MTKIYSGESIASLVDVVDELTYINYAHNRRISPAVSVERWRKAYGPTTDAMETRYQRELEAGR